MSVATYIRDVFDTLQNQFDPNFVSVLNLQDLGNVLGSAFNVGIQYVGTTLKDIVLLRPLTSWVELPGVVQGHYNPFMPEPGLEVYNPTKSVGLDLESFWTGMNNGMCLSFPSSPAQIYAVGALFIWGLPSAAFAQAGCVCGTLVGLIPILLGSERLFGLWHQYEMVPPIFGVFLTTYLSLHLWGGIDARDDDLTWENKRWLARRFWLTFFGSLVNTAGLFPWIEGINASGGGTPFQPGEVPGFIPGWIYIACALFYFIGIAGGLLYWHGLYGFAFYILAQYVFSSSRFSVLVSPERQRRIYETVRWTGVFLINTGSVFALTWVGTDAMVYGNAGFLYTDRATMDFKHPKNMLWSLAYSSEGDIPVEPAKWDFQGDDGDDEWDSATDLTQEAEFNLYSYGDDWPIRSPYNMPGESTDIDELWHLREVNKWKTDERFTNPLLDDVIFNRSVWKDRSSASSIEHDTEVENVALYTMTTKGPDENNPNDIDRFVYPDYPVPRLTREDVRPNVFADKKSFLSEIMRGVFRADTTVAMKDRLFVLDEYREFEEIEETRVLIDWRRRYRSNPLYSLTYPSVEWFGSKFRTHARHKLNVNQTYDAASRRGMLMNYLSFVERTHLWSSQLAPQSMPRRAYNHQFRGNIQEIAAWNLLDVHYAQRYDVLRGKGGMKTKSAHASPPWYDLPQRGQAPWYGKQGRYGAQKPRPPADYRLLPSMEGAKSVVTFDLPGWNLYSQEAKHALHEELWPQASAAPRSQPGLKSNLASDEAQKTTSYGEKIQRIEAWFRPDAKHADDVLNYFGRQHVPSAPMYVGWDENNKKMLVRQARLPNFIDHKVTVPRQGKVPQTNLTGAENDVEMTPNGKHHASGEKQPEGLESSAFSTGPRPVWFRFSAWAPNGILNPGKKHFYRTYDLNATTMELQRFVALFDFKNPDEEQDDATRMDIMEDDGDGRSVQADDDQNDFNPALREKIFGQIELAKERETRSMGSDVGYEQSQDRSLVASLTKTYEFWYEMRYRVPFNTLSSDMPLGFARAQYDWTDDWDVLSRMPQADLSHLENKVANDVPSITKMVGTDYGSIGYLLPPGLGGVAWPGSYDVRKVPDGAREKTMACTITKPNWRDYSHPVAYVLQSRAFDMRNIDGLYDVGLFHRRMMDDANYFENPPEDRPSWTLAPAEFERIYETYRKPSKEVKKTRNFGLVVKKENASS